VVAGHLVAVEPARLRTTWRRSSGSHRTERTGRAHSDHSAELLQAYRASAALRELASVAGTRSVAVVSNRRLHVRHDLHPDPFHDHVVAG